MDLRSKPAFTACLTLVALVTSCSGERLQQPDTTRVRNDLLGQLPGQVDFAQTHVVAASRRLFDPFLVPHKNALIMFRPQAPVSEVDMTIRLGGKQTTVRMNRPDALPGTAIYDHENTFSGRIIEGEYPAFRESTFSYQIPWNLFTADAQISFSPTFNSSLVGTLPASKFMFMTPESEGLLLMNIKGCVFKDEPTCRTTLDQFDGEYNPTAARIAAREMLSELPTQRLHLGTGKAYWPRIVALGEDGKPQVFDKENAMEWAQRGDETLPAKVGMGDYWRAASNLGEMKNGYPVTISGQLLDAPDGMPTFPPGVAASCGRNSCNYPYFPDGFWHETGHGLDLPHDTPGRYEDWAYRAYDNVFLPNTHPAPHWYGLPVDYLGLHYFGHVVGSLALPPWHPSTASAPLIDEFESLGLKSSEGSSWKRYIAPFTHQQTLRVQQRFGHLPEGVPYADVADDHRPIPSRHTSPPAPQHNEQSRQLDDGPLRTKIGPSNLIAAVDGPPIETAVPVHTLVVTFSDPGHNSDGVNQIYPAILSNYGNVFRPANPPSLASSPKSPAQGSALMTVDGRCLASEHGTLALKACDDEAAQLDLQIVPPVNAQEARLAPVVIVRNRAGDCLEFNLTFRRCVNAEMQVRWWGREDLTHTRLTLKLQESNSGKFITPSKNGTPELQPNSDNNELQHFQPGENRTPHSYTVDIQYADGSYENHHLYTGLIRKDALKTALFNISSQRSPVSALLRVDGATVHARSLEDNNLPEVISMGAEHGEQIDQAWPPQWLYSAEQKACLGATDQGIGLVACNAAAIWRLPTKRDTPYQFDTVEPVDISGRCIDHALRPGECHFPVKDTLWWTRQDLTYNHSEVYMQELTTGRFITTMKNSNTVQLMPLGNNADQRFRTQRLVTFNVKHGNQCLINSGRTVTLKNCSPKHLGEWYLIGTLENAAFPGEDSELTLMNRAGQCLNDQLRLQSCTQPRSSKLTWRTRKDLVSGLIDIRLQNAENGKFLDIGSDGKVSLQPLAGESQVFTYRLTLP